MAEDKNKPCACGLADGAGPGERGPTDTDSSTSKHMKDMVSQIESRCGKAGDEWSGMPSDKTNRLNPR